MLLKRDAALILGEPFVEGLQPRVQPTSDVNVATAAEDLIEIALELEHIGEILCSRETKVAVRTNK